MYIVDGKRNVENMKESGFTEGIQRAIILEDAAFYTSKAYLSGAERAWCEVGGPRKVAEMYGRYARGTPIAILDGLSHSISNIGCRSRAARWWLKAGDKKKAVKWFIRGSIRPSVKKQEIENFLNKSF